MILMMNFCCYFYTAKIVLCWRATVVILLLRHHFNSKESRKKTKHCMITPLLIYLHFPHMLTKKLDSMKSFRQVQKMHIIYSFFFIPSFVPFSLCLTHFCVVPEEQWCLLCHEQHRGSVYEWPHM